MQWQYLYYKKQLIVKDLVNEYVTLKILEHL